jgi:hypothetical protein
VKLRTFASFGLAMALLVASFTGTEVAAAPVAHWWVALGFANRELGAVVEGSGVEQGVHCELALYATSDGGATWAAPIVLTRRAGCDAGGSSDAMAISADGAWFLATPQGLFEGRVGLHSFALVQAFVPTVGETVCSVAAAAASVWLVLADGCGLWGQAVVLVSTDDGATWARSLTVPFGSLDASSLIAAVPPDSLAVEGPERAWLIGTKARKGGPLEVGRTVDAGRSWQASTLPCPTDRLAGFVGASGEDLVALCLNGPSAGYAPMEVVTSSDGGATWTERCNNGPSWILRAVGRCPGFGYPGMVAVMGDGVLVLAVGYPLGAVEASLDGGRTWKVVARSAATFVTLSQGSDAVWMLALGPTSAGLRLAESTNGWSWQRVALP